MSDTANPPALASADDFDARLKRTDEDRWLATRYAPDGKRPLLVALLFGLAVYITVVQDKDEDDYNVFDHLIVKVTAPLQSGLDWLLDRLLCRATWSTTGSGI